MLLPSLHKPGTGRRLWRVRRAVLYGAILGAVAALIKMFAPGAEARATAAIVREIAGAAAVFAILCAVAAGLRNFIVRRLIAQDHG